ncbi:hypothetical protein [Brevibacillus laterosporus]|uniref:Uncharacterized protein n=1 Tax=Brevibacillus laterosporus TaxID=1465 RepID=A0AAP3DKD6_BRELA|nr:hypothetical protein [Brevibacillus laterosporus]MCR8982461.1 hypothetical protein [Brevibacillus laterosporus]MCZ0809617.1 hypothetical protein [Brevibacillus laterosporus]MCZ0828150.1 hypothetical protein [Brevibacillus laterosporus]MCZ0852172.1 hypothetical protein [Brevibacillus laterosporus]
MTLLLVIVAVIGIIHNLFGILDRVSKLLEEKPPTKPDGDNPTAIAMPKPEEEETQKPAA